MTGRGRPRLHDNRRWVDWAQRVGAHVSKVEAPVEVYVTAPDGDMQKRTQGVSQHNHPLLPKAQLVGTYTAPFDSRAFIADVEAMFGVGA